MSTRNELKEKNSIFPNFLNMDNSVFGDMTTQSLSMKAEKETTFESNYVSLVLEICIMIVILIGNSLTIAAICATPSLQTVTYRLVEFLVIYWTHIEQIWLL